MLSDKHQFVPYDQLQIREITAAGINLDYSKSLLNDEAISLLTELANASDINNKLQKLNSNNKLNTTEDREVNHLALRNPKAYVKFNDELTALLDFANKFKQGQIKGATGKVLKTILHIGIGGSYLGPKLVYEAFKTDEITCHFVANVDPAAINAALEQIDPETTLIICVSKSGTTTETIKNTQTAIKYFQARITGDVADHLVFICANIDAHTSLVDNLKYYFAIDEGTGGRYSVWSPASLAVASACGATVFSEFLAGAHAMDQHVLSTENWDNIATTLALVHLWHQLVLKNQSHCVVAYSYHLRYLSSYLQQLVMESNGKSVNINGENLNYDTSAIWWGGEGTCDQHSYFQLLLQGTRKFSADFIYPLNADNKEDQHTHLELIAHCLGQSKALYLGKDINDTKQDEALASHLVVPGYNPTNLISFDKVSPDNLGALIALYEHMTIILGWIWEINSFDQWGVEFGKHNFKETLDTITNNDWENCDHITQNALNKLNKN